MAKNVFGVAHIAGEAFSRDAKKTAASQVVPVSVRKRQLPAVCAIEKGDCQTVAIAIVAVGTYFHGV